MQRAVVLVKPDGLQRGLVGEIIGRFERKGLKLTALKMVQLTDEILVQWYAHHKDKPFFPKLTGFMKQSPVVAMLSVGSKMAGVVALLVSNDDRLQLSIPKRHILAQTGQHRVVRTSID